jgi:hypothetical protein
VEQTQQLQQLLAVLATVLELRTHIQPQEHLDKHLYLPVQAPQHLEHWVQLAAEQGLLLRVRLAMYWYLTEQIGHPPLGLRASLF